MLDPELEVFVRSVVAVKLLVHGVNLNLHILDLVLPRLDLLLQLLNLVVKHKLELFKLASLFSKLLNLVLLVLYGSLPFQQLILHAFYVLLFPSGFLQFFVQFILFVGELFDKLITIILLDLMFVADKHQI